MNLRQTILFIFLTIILIASSYLLLELIDRHSAVYAIVLLLLLVIGDIAALGGFFIRYMKSNTADKH